MEIVYRFFIGSIIFNLLFSGFSYALTTFADQPSDIFEVPISQEELLEQGVILVNATTFEVTYGDDWIYYTMNDVKQRVKWDSDLVRGDGFSFQKQSFVEKYLDTWVLPQYVGVWFGTSKTGLIDGFFTNSTVIANFDTSKNYTRFNLETNDLGFIVPTSADGSNITKAILETGKVNMTIADATVFTDDTIQAFVKWYWSNLFSWEYTGLPYGLSVFVKIIVFVNLASAILVAREALKV